MNQATLPITELKETFQAAITKSPVVIVAPTGSGKSTQIPPWCAALSDASVLVVEPRRVACRSLARWVAQQHGEPLGQSVGYTVRFEDVSTNARTRIRFVTPGVALRYAAGPELDQYGTIILDKFHERGPVIKDKTPLQPNRAGLIAHLLREWDACAYVRRRRGKGWGNGQEEVLLDADSLLPDERHAALILETVGIAKGTRLQLMGRTALPCTFEDLEAAGIGTSQLTTPRLEGEDIVAESAVSVNRR